MNMIVLRAPVLWLGVFLVVALTALRLADPLPFQTLRLSYFDLLQRIEPREYQDLPVRVVDIDEDSLAEFGQWPWPRDKLADLVQKLSAYGAAVIAFDVLFAEPDRSSLSAIMMDPDIYPALSLEARDALSNKLATDLIFGRAIKDLPVVLGQAAGSKSRRGARPYDKAGIVEVGNAPGAGLNNLPFVTPVVPVLRSAAGGLGNVNVSPVGSYGTVREVPLMWRSDAGYWPTFSLEALRLAFGQPIYLLNGSPDIPGFMQSVQLADYRIPTNDRGEIWVYYRWDTPELYVSAADVLNETDPDYLAQKLEGQIVLVGTSAAGLLDIRATALGESVPGVSIHAQIIEQVLTERYLYRNDTIAGLEVLAFAILGLMLTWIMHRSGALNSVIAGGNVAAIVVLGSWVAFRHQAALFDATFPLLGGFLVFGLLTAFQFIVTERDKRIIRRSFSQYLAPSVLDQMERRGFQITLDGELRDLTVMFTDIRNFSPMAEKVPPQKLVALLNELFTDLSESILEQGGTIDKFIGDSIMAFWNAPLDVPDHPRKAALAALAIEKATRAFSARHPEIDPPIAVCLGVASGTASVGNMGSRQRFNYSVIGDTVNVAARLESNCRHLSAELVFSQRAFDATPELAWIYAGRLSLKGISERQPTFLLVGDAEMKLSDAFKRFEEAYGSLAAALENGHSAEPFLSECLSLAPDLSAQLMPYLDRIADRRTDFEPDQSPIQIATIAT